MTVSSSPIFVVGPPRSGTHLLRFCLAQHSNIFIAPETAFFIRAYGNRRLDRGLFKERRSGDLVDELLDESGDPTMKEYDSFRTELKEQVAGAGTYREFGDMFYGSMAQREGKTRWGEKTPLHAFYVPQIFDVYPNAKVLFVMREAKNTIASTLKSGHVRSSFYKALAVYLACLSERNRLATHPNVMPIDYEELVESPEGNLRRICEFLGEPYQSSMLQPGMLDTSYTDDVMTLDESIAIKPDNPDKWRRVLTEPQGELIDNVVTGRQDRFSRVSLQIEKEIALLKLRNAKNRAGYFHIKRAVSKPPRSVST